MRHVTVKDVMTWPVISVVENTCFKDIAGMLLTHAVSALPVLDDDGHVVGVVSEADLLRKEEFRERFPGERYRPPTPSGQDLGTGKARGVVARQLMSTPAVTVGEEVSVISACRLMQSRGVKRLPVIDEHGRLAGIVSRCDLMKVFIRSDRDIQRDIREHVLVESLWMDTSCVQVTVKDGVVTLSGRMLLRRDAQIALWMTREVNGVVDVVDELAWERDDTCRI
ncbi:hypothetical protein Aple_000560 [Acrocarpospora pleiomorpha]|uniref:CBS domain-containing protein n=1 Tax=Acrocarpospora pleiomorpha TaxID=90975 RepID=A0A5M3XCC3_9ACTN|nr:CBS domain-containing protein [Acrocarpospora pleiomorpha]GES17161.1 hypothetical protein Aple_000560 [Acrocarpospora pleiomorpha]